MSTSRFIPSTEIERLTNNSLECFISDVSKAISLTDNLLPDGAKVSEILSTYSSHAIVLTEDQQVFQVSFNRGLSGVTLGDVLPREAKVFENPSEAFEEAAQSFIAGDKDYSVKLLRDIAARTEHPPIPTSALVENTLASFAADRPWKKLFFDKEDEITKAAGEADDSFQAKFEKILKDNNNGPDLSYYKELVLRDIGELAAKAQDASDQATRSHITARLAQTESVSDVPFAAHLASFACDLADDLSRSSKALEEVRSNVQDVKQLARVHDAFASRWASYSTAARFIKKAAINISTTEAGA